ncbi:MAG: phosphatidylserine decarboxylase family protein [Deltaproteobacteria bacterium]|nr:phosphatidylserine decarboxylase family protein [Deltaproteobacteria bacterium]
MKLIAKEGIKLIIFPLVCFIIFLCLYLIFNINASKLKYIFIVLSVIFFILFLFSIYFFRDPERKVSADKNEIISPADGKIIYIERVYDDRYLNKDVLKISIFMSLFNVHVNRIPISGKVLEIKYNNGKFFSANLNKASLENEYNAVILETDCIDTDDLNKKKLAFVQIAGFVARRIVCKINKGEKVIAGNRFGLIKYGSRMDLYLPLDFTTYVKVNDKVYAGKTIIGKII